MTIHDGWEQIAGPNGPYVGGHFFTHRLKVPNGWLYRSAYIPADKLDPQDVRVIFVPEAGESA